MRVFVYGMQSSGSSVFSLWLSQLKDSIGVIDVYAKGGAFSHEDFWDGNVFLKATVNKSKLSDHFSKYKPHKSVLYLRNPYQNFVSLSTKRYRDLNGDLLEKFRIMDSVLANESDSFDTIVTYEDFIKNREDFVDNLFENGVPASMKNYDFKRGFYDILDFNTRRSKVLKESYESRWGVGNIHTGKLKNIQEIKYEISQDVINVVNEICPNMVAYYEKR